LDTKDQEIIHLRRKIVELEAKLTDYQDKSKTEEKTESENKDESDDINEEEFHDFDEEDKQESCEEIYNKIFSKDVQFDSQVRSYSSSVQT
jgi:predicted Zn-dependent protease